MCTCVCTVRSWSCPQYLSLCVQMLDARCSLCQVIVCMYMNAKMYVCEQVYNMHVLTVYVQFSPTSPTAWCYLAADGLACNDIKLLCLGESCSDGLGVLGVLGVLGELGENLLVSGRLGDGISPSIADAST